MFAREVHLHAQRSILVKSEEVRKYHEKLEDSKSNWALSAITLRGRNKRRLSSQISRKKVPTKTILFATRMSAKIFGFGIEFQRGPEFTTV